MPKYFVHLTFLLFIITAITGFIMRAMPFQNTFANIPFENILHAHSHLALLGWCFLGAFLIFVALFWENFKNSKEVSAIIITTFIVTIIMFIAFLAQGYALYSIILSTVHIFIEYWVISFIWRQLKDLKKLSKTGTLFMKGALITLFVSTLAPFTLGGIAAAGLKDSQFFDMAVYFYLHFQYNGWLFFYLIGMLLFILAKRNIILDQRTLTTGFFIYFIALLPNYLLSILCGDLGIDLTGLAMLGGIGQWIGVLTIIIAFWNVWKKIVDYFSNFIGFWLYVIFILLLMKSTMELGLISPTIANSVYDTRNIIIGYLHLTLLGFVSIFILTQYQMLNIFKVNERKFKIAMIIFFIGFCLNEICLFTVGLFTWMNIYIISYYLEGLLFASIVLLIGITMIALSVYGKQKNSPSSSKN